MASNNKKNTVPKTTPKVAPEEEGHDKEEKPNADKTSGVIATTESMTLDTSVQFRSTAPEPLKDDSLVKVMFSYGEQYTGAKHHKEGIVYEMSAACAELFINRGIAEKC